MTKSFIIFILVITIFFQSFFVISHVNAQLFGSGNNSESKTLNIGYFLNLNHLQAVIGLNNGDFQKFVGNNVKIKNFIFNAGPSAIESLFAKQIDVAYVGPNPAINAFLISEGKDIRVISGAASGGAVLVVRNDSGINTVKDLGNKKFASPQIGNTQDVALRKFLLDNGYKTSDKGGNVHVISLKNSDIFTLMLKGEIDGAWVPEPWGEKLVKEANGRIFLDERTLWPDGNFVTSLMIVRTDYLQQNPDIIKKLLEAHINETMWINQHKDEALLEYNVQLQKITGQMLPAEQIKQALSRMKLTYDPIPSSLFKMAKDAFQIGYLSKEEPDLNKLFELSILNEIIKEKDLIPINITTTLS